LLFGAESNISHCNNFPYDQSKVKQTNEPPHPNRNSKDITIKLIVKEKSTTLMDQLYGLLRKERRKRMYTYNGYK